MVDEEYEQNFGDVIENRLLWPSVQRTDLNSIFTCQAINTKLIDPKEFSLVLDLYRKFFGLQFFILIFLFFQHHFIVLFCFYSETIKCLHFKFNKPINIGETIRNNMPKFWF